MSAFGGNEDSDQSLLTNHDLGVHGPSTQGLADLSSQQCNRGFARIGSWFTSEHVEGAERFGIVETADLLALEEDGSSKKDSAIPGVAPRQHYITAND
jgi:hypothetical protein